MPGWIVIDRSEIKGNTMILTVRVRKWHPSFWLEVIKYAVRSFTSDKRIS